MHARITIPLLWIYLLSEYLLPTNYNSVHQYNNITTEEFTSGKLPRNVLLLKLISVIYWYV